LNDFVITHPQIQLQARVGGSQELLDAMRDGQIEIVSCVRPETEPQNIKTVPMRWIGQHHLLDRDILPLALLEEPCLFRTTALRLLEAADIPFRIVVETASLSVIRAAVQAGLAITCRNPLFIESGLMPVLPENGLPALPRHGYALFTADQPSPAASHLADLVRQSVLTLE
jgi:DNA-binding transcriptional LysR family regulator